MQGNYSAAIAVLNRSIGLRPSTDAYVALGAAYFLLHQFEDAVGVFQQSLKLDNQDWLNWGNLGDALYWAPGRRPEAQAAYQRAILLAEPRVRINPRDASTLAYLAYYNAMVGDRKTALDQIKRAQSIAPADPEIAFRSASICNHFGNIEGTLSWLQKSADLGYSRTIIRDTPDFESVKSSSDFQKLVTGN